MKLLEYNSVCWPSVGSQDMKPTESVIVKLLKASPCACKHTGGASTAIPQQLLLHEEFVSGMLSISIWGVGGRKSQKATLQEGWTPMYSMITMI